MKPKIYIVGKVTGLPYPEVVEKFNNAQLQLEAKGFEVINPVKIVQPETEWNKAMKICIKAMLDADAIYALPCKMNNSKGAAVELFICDKLEIDVYDSIWCLTQKYFPHDNNLQS